MKIHSTSKKHIKHQTGLARFIFFFFWERLDFKTVTVYNEYPQRGQGRESENRQDGVFKMSVPRLRDTPGVSRYYFFDTPIT